MLTVYNSKSSKPNGSASPSEEKDLAIFKSFHPASSMAWSSTCCSPRQNPYDYKNKLAGGTSTKGSNRYTIDPAATRAFTPVVVFVVAPLVIFDSADPFVIRYSKDDIKQILKIVLDLKFLVLVLALIVAAVPHYKGSRKRALEAWFPDIYWGKTHLKCYNFFQKCKDHFATTGATGLNRVLFVATFLKNTALFWWQQHQHKIEDQTNIPISWERFKAFFCQSLGKFEAFVDTIWSTIKKDSKH